MQNFRALGAPPQTPKTAPPHCEFLATRLAILYSKRLPHGVKTIILKNHKIIQRAGFFVFKPSRHSISEGSAPRPSYPIRLICSSLLSLRPFVRCFKQKKLAIQASLTKVLVAILLDSKTRRVRNDWMWSGIQTKQIFYRHCIRDHYRTNWFCFTGWVSGRMSNVS